MRTATNSDRIATQDTVLTMMIIVALVAFMVVAVGTVLS